MVKNKKNNKQAYIIAGPNGAGKTTSAKYLLTKFLDINEFVNADEIARGLSPFNPRSVDLTASKLMLNRIKSLMKAEKNFAFETTLSGRNYIKLIAELQKENYLVNLIFLYLDNPQEAKKRVAYRVKTGGHFIADEDIERRYFRGLKNLIDEYLDIINYAIVIDATSTQREIIAKKTDKQLKILSTKKWDKILSDKEDTK
jgi:predicted ABC-type ATPase